MTRFDQMAFNSSFAYERIVAKGNKTFSVALFGLTVVTIPHNLGYKPYTKVWITFGNGNYYSLFVGPNSYGAFGAAGAQVENYYTDANNLYIQIGEYGTSAYNGTIYYRIYGEPQLT